MITKSKFIRFLKDNNALNEWLYEIFHNPCCFYRVTNIKDLFDLISYRDWVDSFDWRCSRNGFTFWDNINEKWKKICQK